MIRAVLDANVVVSALIRPEGPAGLVVDLAVRGVRVRAVSSPAILDEYRRALDYPKVRRCLRTPVAEVRAWVDAFALIADPVTGERSVRAVDADPYDDKYIAAALEGRATHVVSGDGHLLAPDVFEGVRIVSPRRFLSALGRR